MRFRKLHPWRVSYHEAVRLQDRLRECLVLKGFKGLPRTIAGADVAYSKQTNQVYAGIVVFDFRSMEPLDKSFAVAKASFPYVPGLLSFREAPILLRAFSRLKSEPDVLLFDGQGIAHPRGFGLASHMGLLLDKPSVGCAKDVLVGEYGPVGSEAGSYSYLFYKGKRVGAAVRTRKLVKPVFVSQGHKISLSSSIKIVFSSCRGYRLPEPLRWAHNLVSQLRSSFEEKSKIKAGHYEGRSPEAIPATHNEITSLRSQ
ncbi:MAG TPA: deoxyribonuclease V [Candidatus Hypogeohydataceae bacterium YC41]